MVPLTADDIGLVKKSGEKSLLRADVFAADGEKIGVLSGVSFDHELEERSIALMKGQGAIECVSIELKGKIITESFAEALFEVSLLRLPGRPRVLVDVYTNTCLMKVRCHKKHMNRVRKFFKMYSPAHIVCQFKSVGHKVLRERDQSVMYYM